MWQNMKGGKLEDLTDFSAYSSFLRYFHTYLSRVEHTDFFVEVPV